MKARNPFFKDRRRIDGAGKLLCRTDLNWTDHTHLARGHVNACNTRTVNPVVTQDHEKVTCFHCKRIVVKMKAKGAL